MPLPTPTPPPTPAEYKAILLHCARHLAPGGGFYGGPLSVTIEQFDEGRDSVRVKATKKVDGIETPARLQATRSLFGAEAELLRHFLSDDERSILRRVGELQPCQANDVLAAVAPSVSKNAFWVLWKNLQVRGLVEQDAADKFSLGREWVKSVASEAA